MILQAPAVEKPTELTFALSVTFFALWICSGDM